jgi:predicted transcriptional regulator
MKDSSIHFKTSDDVKEKARLLAMQESRTLSQYADRAIRKLNDEMERKYRKQEKAS